MHGKRDMYVNVAVYGVMAVCEFSNSFWNCFALIRLTGVLSLEDRGDAPGELKSFHFKLKICRSSKRNMNL